MIGFWILLRREIAARRALFVASAAMGLFVALLPWLRGGSTNPAELRAVAAMTAALSWSGLLALGLGATCLARDLVEARLGFDFRLPVSGVAIWGARLLGAYLVVLLAGGLVFLIPAAFDFDLAGAAAGLDLFVSQTARPWDPGPLAVEGLLAWTPLLLATLLLLANVAGLALFGHRAWSALDLLSLAAVVAAAAVSIGRLREWGAVAAPWWLFVGACAAGGLGLIAASAAQLLRGRIELARAHAALSSWLAGAAILVMTAAIGYASWFLSPEPEDLDSGYLNAEALGSDLVGLGGSALGRNEDSPGVVFRFLIAPRSGRWWRLGPTPFWGGSGWGWDVKAAADGASVAWLERHTEGIRLVRIDLGQATPEPTQTAIEWRSAPVAWALSPDGQKVASRQRGGGAQPDRLLVEEIATGRLLYTLAIEGCREEGPIAFLDSQTVRLACGVAFPGMDAISAHSYVVDLETGVGIPSSVIPRWGYPIDYRRGEIAGHGRILRRLDQDRQAAELEWGQENAESAEPPWELIESASGRRLATTPLPPGFDPHASQNAGRILPDGSFVLLLREGQRNALAVYSSTGTLARRIELRATPHVLIAGGTTDGHALLLLSREVRDDRRLPSRCDWRAELLDLAGGKPRLLGEPFSWYGQGSVRQPSTILWSCEGAPFWFDSVGGSLQPLLGGT